ncbi:MAG: HAD-IIIA family hydrolase [Candidatus Dadabacteria bacterium]|nr:MAG: HAD-IIIA family hydrolase [Candidatus Dadabacteria bacterium]
MEPVALKSIKAIFFDADDTLFSVYPSVGDIYSSCASEFGLKISAELINRSVLDVWQQFRDSFQRRNYNYKTTEEQEKKLWYQFIEMVFKACSEEKLPAGLSDRIYEAFSDPASRRLKAGVKELLEELQNKYLLGVLSNNDRRIESVIEGLGIRQHFTWVYPAFVTGYKKPSPEVYRWIEKKHGFRSDQLLHIGDSFENDYQAALNAGWHAIWLSNGNNVGQGAEVLAAGTIKDLTKILSSGKII